MHSNTNQHNRQYSCLQGTLLLLLCLTIILSACTLSQIKTTAPLRYKVRPNLAIIDGKSVAKVHVMLSG